MSSQQVVQAQLDEYLAAASKAFRELPADAPVEHGQLLLAEIEWARRARRERQQAEAQWAADIHSRTERFAVAWRQAIEAGHLRAGVAA